MANYHEIKTARTGKDGKTYWTRIGTMWAEKNNSFRITFDAMPIPTIYQGNIRVEAMAFEPTLKTGQTSQRSNNGGTATDDEIPF
ncbi:hypothetical protein UFOVP1301_69 [uncultured Caudovirales phage]|uniref:Uncharacterized protein n=1 Tax=uncultured Caudovirales phage TaxID=2100421 RepID=A0A6J5NLW9_9CAUD|nr:hypothetical protein UFOVP663_54 [uncultured Caudovirales phage]CAB4168688.1 hypothetical protein UFOVP894_30 [uncultured Caudovirales phage]CAB4181836.1 hypothetical protein UFOVP1069_71 [uncultured Caudovirales phage]CAB4196285.1 hypothetical protein UFOVP1301_69 [uncultured Caudovirales phage]CAB4210795.1 hypothetical protein UFOVP1415_45 [uncultured Caudovirales phage]